MPSQQICPWPQGAIPLHVQLPDVMPQRSPAWHWVPLHVQRAASIEQVDPRLDPHCIELVQPQRMSMH